MGRIWGIVLLTLSMGLIGCTRNVDSSKVRIQLPNLSEKVLVKEKLSSLGTNAATPFDSSISAATLSEINCYGVLVSEGSSATAGDGFAAGTATAANYEFYINSAVMETVGGSKTNVNFGPNKMVAPEGHEMHIDVPVGNLKFSLLGFKSVDAASCVDFRFGYIPGVMSNGYLLWQEDVEIVPGPNNEININLSKGNLFSSTTIVSDFTGPDFSFSYPDACLPTGCSTVPPYVPPAPLPTATKEWDFLLGSALINVNRSSTATYLDADGLIKSASSHIARYEYDKDANPLGLLVESYSENKITRSDDFSNAAWSKLGSTTPLTVVVDATVDPMGGSSADKLIDNDSSNDGQDESAVFSIGAQPDGWYTGSVFVKAGTSDIVAIWMEVPASTCTGMVYKVGVGTSGLSYCSGGPSGVIDYGNGWYRIWMSVNKTGGSTVSMKVLPAVSDTFPGGVNRAATGDAYFWGAQIENGSGPTSIIPTTGTLGIRSEDIVESSETFAGWFDTDNGSFFIEAQSGQLNKNPNQYVMSLHGISNPADDHFSIAFSDTIMGSWFTMSETATLHSDIPGTANSWYSGSINRMAFTYDYVNSYHSFGANGVVHLEDSGTSLPAVDVFKIGSGPTGSPDEGFNGHIRKIKYYDTVIQPDQIGFYTNPANY